MLDITALVAMEKIDGAKALDMNIGTIKTRRGITSIDHLSTGCKTIIVYIYMINNTDINKRFLDISYCGANAIDSLFEIANGHEEIEFILRHTDSLYKCKKRDYIINGDKRIRSLLYI